MSKRKKFVDIDSLKFYNTLLEIRINRTLENYALRNDVTSVLRFKGTKTSDELGALTGMETGDVYSIVSGGTGSTYKVGSEYAYDGSDWVELGPAFATADAVADADAGFTTGDQVYDYIENLAISDSTINALFASQNP